ncbi:MAG: hypothetical protein ABI949_14400 [Ilumatobacteraceae bacterium]
MTSTVDTSQASLKSDELHLLHIYLRDHEAAAVGGLRLFQLCSKANQGTSYSADLERLTAQVQASRDALRRICRQFGVRWSNVGRAITYAGATLGRVKTNGRALKYSPLSRVIELEAMSSGVLSQLRLWESLSIVAEFDYRLDETELVHLVGVAEQKLVDLRRLHDQATHEAFG